MGGSTDKSDFEAVLQKFHDLKEFVQNHCNVEEETSREQLKRLEGIEAANNTIRDTMIKINTRLEKEEKDTQQIYNMIGLIKDRVTRVEAIMGIEIKPAVNALAGVLNTKTILIFAVTAVLISAFYYGVITETNVDGIVDKTLDKIPSP